VPRKQGGVDADRCVPVVLRVYCLQNPAQAKGWRLLRILQLRHREVSADPDAARVLHGVSSKLAVPRNAAQLKRKLKYWRGLQAENS